MTPMDVRAAPAKPTCPEPVTFSVDVEELPGIAAGPRAEQLTARLMDFLEERGIRGTFFIEGRLARRVPNLVRVVAMRGHEVASHGFRHVDLVDENPAGFATGMAETKARLEDLAGCAVTGFRAPRFSLVHESRWAVDMLSQLGFGYSSSVLPGRGIPFGYRGAPARPFLWPTGLLEIPCTVARAGPLRLPFLGGLFLRYVPPHRYRLMMKQTAGQACWTYCHPHDIDTAPGFQRLPQFGLIGSTLQAFNRDVVLNRWAGLALRPAPPFRDRVVTLRLGAVAFGG